MRRSGLAWLIVVLLVASGAGVNYGVAPAAATDDHDRVHELRRDGDIMPLTVILDRAELAGTRVLEAELEREGGRLVYELELLDASGRVRKAYYDAATGQPLSRPQGD
jgi:uncharacterized membrane protein YkoI